MNWLPLILAIVPGIVAGLFSYRVATKTSRINAAATASVAAVNAALERQRMDNAAALERQRLDTDRARIDAEAYDRAKSIYEATLSSLERQVLRLQTQMDRVTDQLSREQDTSNSLRAEIIALKNGLTGLTGSVATLRENQVDAPPPHSEEETS